LSKPIPKKLLLPKLKLTKVAKETESGTASVTIPNSTLSYHTKSDTSFNNSFNLFPVVLDSKGVPWSEAVIYILSRLKDTMHPIMGTYASIAEDLAVYRRFLDESGLDWISFPSQKLMRPTYRFNGHLKLLASSGEMALSTAKRTMGTIISFYRWIQEEKLLSIDNPPWKETDRYIEIKNVQGFTNLKKVTSTDLSISTKTQNDPYAETIEDGGKLRPLPLQEQKWLIDALDSLGNTEMKIIHLFSLLTGARIQTVLTLKVKHVIADLDINNSNEIRLPVGPGTSIDTKNNKKMVLHIPKWFYTQLQIYVYSDRAKRRRLKAQGGDTEEQYLFLSVRSVPLYEDKSSKQNYNPENNLRHSKIGQGVRQFITEKIIPFIREKYNIPNFHYRFHDLRATAGMNWTDYGLSLVEQKKLSLREVREFVKTRMGHESAAITDRYLQYRQHQQLTKEITIGYEEWIKKLSTKEVGCFDD
jgi:integrase